MQKSLLILCMSMNYDQEKLFVQATILVNLFYKVCKVDSAPKKPDYVTDYLMTKKHYMTTFKRIFDYEDEILDDYPQLGE